MGEIIEIKSQQIKRKLSEVFGGEDQANLWLNTPNQALGWQIPAQLLKTPEGIQKVWDVVVRIEHGIFA